MPLFTIRLGQHLRIDADTFIILRRLTEGMWQLQNDLTGELRAFSERDLLNRFTRDEMVFVQPNAIDCSQQSRINMKLTCDLAVFPPHLIAIAQQRLKYLKELDQSQPISMTKHSIEQLITTVAARLGDANPPGWCSVYRDYRKWIAAGRDLRAIIFRYADRGKSGSRAAEAVQAIINRVIESLYMTPERKRVPEIHMEIARQVDVENRLRPEGDKLTTPSRRTIYREIAAKHPYDLVRARYGKRRASEEFRVSMNGPETSRPLERVVMDHTPCDMIIVDDQSMLPLGRPTITSALDEHTRCLMGIYTGFEPPSVLSVMRCLKHAILPKTDIATRYPSIKNEWGCYGVPEMVVVDNPAEFHSRHFEIACLQIGCDIQYAKVQVPWYKGKLERFQKTMNHDFAHGKPGTTFSNILERSDYNPAKHAVVMLSTFREILHKWIVDVYLQTPHRGIGDTPAHRWQVGVAALPPPLPPSARELDIVLGMTLQRVVFHYGIELESLRYNSPQLGELRRRTGTAVKVEITFDPGNLGHINVLDPADGSYLRVPAIDQNYANGITLWQHKVIRGYAQRELKGRTDTAALAQAKAEIRALIDHDLHRKSTRLHKRHARFSESDTTPTISQPVSTESCSLHAQPAPAISEITHSNVFVDDPDELPVYEAGLNLPRPATADSISATHHQHDWKKIN